MKAEIDDSSIFTEYRLTVTLTLTAGRWNNNGITNSTVDTWITMGGSSASYLTGSSKPSQIVNALGEELVIKYSWFLGAPTTPNFIATLDTTKLGTMRTYTSVSTLLQAGSPTTASTSQWASAH
jgi:hypothetical protein